MNTFQQELLTLGRESFRRKEYAKAEKYLTQLTELAERFADVHNMLGVIFHASGRYSHAREAFEAALRINPHYSEAALNLAIVYNDTGLYERAREVWKSANAAQEKLSGASDPIAVAKVANLLAEAGDTWLAVGDLARAEGEFRRALELAPGFVDIRLKLATTLRDEGDAPGALAELDRALASSPGYLMARVQRGVTLYSMGRQGEAKAEWEECLKQEPGHKAATMYLSFIKAP